MLRRAARLAAPAAAAGLLYSQRECTNAERAAPQRLFSWGVLRPTETEEKIPAKAPPSEVSFWASKGLRVVHMSYGMRHAAAVDDKGGVWAWGSSSPTPQQLPCRSRVASLASTDSSLYAITSRGDARISLASCASRPRTSCSCWAACLPPLCLSCPPARVHSAL